MMNAIMRRKLMQLMSRQGVSDQAPKARIWIIGAKVKGTKVGTMVTMLIETTGMGPMSLLKIMKLLQGMVEIVCRELRICCTK